MTKIYGILERRTESIIYVGATRSKLSKRLSEHKSASRTYFDDAQLHQYMLEMGLDDFDIELLEEVDDAMSDIKEREYIDYFNTFEFGFNANKGGKGEVNSSVLCLTTQKPYLAASYVEKDPELIGCKRCNVSSAISGKRQTAGSTILNNKKVRCKWASIPDEDFEFYKDKWEKLTGETYNI